MIHEAKEKQAGPGSLSGIDQEEHPELLSSLSLCRFQLNVPRDFSTRMIITFLQRELAADSEAL
jgi:hypothetical protein